MKTKSLYIYPYGEEVIVILSDDANKVKKYIRKNIPEEYNNSWEATIDNTYHPNQNKQGACFVSTDDNIHWICFQKKLKSLYDISILAHEALHITHRILSRRGLLLTPDTEEAYTYLQQDIIKRAGDFLMK